MAQLPLFLVIPFALFVSGCGSSLFNAAPPPVIEVQTSIVIPTVPERNLVCPAIPSIPDPDTSDQRDIAVLIPDLIAVAEHCRSDLAVVRKILEKAAADAAEQNQTPVEP